MKDKIIIVGGGPAGLFCAYKLLEQGFRVDLYDQMSGLGKKFLVAGNGGLNLTHSEELKVFGTRYGKDEKLFNSLINEFSPTDLRKFCSDLGIETFVGTSGRVFPKKLKAAEILLNWIKVLKSNENFNLFLKHRLINITSDKELSFEFENNIVQVQGKKIIFALGGASWEKTGSDGKWKKIFEKLNIKVNNFLPMNCGFEKSWSKYFQENMGHTPLKNILIKIGKHQSRGEIMITPFGIEGGGVYALSNHIRDLILEKGEAKVIIDLKPDLSEETILTKLKKKKAKDSMSNHLRKSLKFNKSIYILLRELYGAEKIDDLEFISKAIKRSEFVLTGMRPISEAISTSGGVAFSGLTQNLEVRAIADIFVIGEMLDFEAPTGGYLLQGCFSSAFRVFKYINSNNT
jgi:uncharacterized flavoprotein (TIGR03862 family)